MKKTKSVTPNKPTLVAFLLDRSGSMASCKDETISGFNGYIKELRKQKADDMRFSLTQFDTHGVDIIHNGVLLKDVNELNQNTYEPRGGTPLYDAIGKTIRATEEKSGNGYKVLFVILTDGQENSSVEWNEQTAKALIKEKEERFHWTFAYIGVGINGFTATTQMAHGTVGASNVMRSSHKNTGKAYRSLATASVSYMCNAGAGGQSVSGVFGKNPTTEDEE